MIKIIKSNNAQEWNSCLAQIGMYDFYHTCSYHKLAESNNEGEGFLYYFQKEEYKIAIPLLKRKIKGTDYFDLASVYGYPGAISNKRQITSAVIELFHSELKRVFVDEKIVSVFSRLNPLIENNLLDGLGRVEKRGETVFVDLELALVDQKKTYRKSLKSELNQLRGKHCVSTRFTDSKEDIDAFILIYNENMKRVNASDYYYFDKNYFNQIFKQTDFDIKLMLAEKNGEIIAGAIFVFTNKIVQYHLAATRNEFIKITPMKLILDDLRIFSSENNYSFLHLGGGLGGEKDSLFRFKSGFSKTFLKFKLWKYIVNEQVYNKLIIEKKDIDDDGFFPYIEKMIKNNITI